MKKETWFEEAKRVAMLNGSEDVEFLYLSPSRMKFLVIHLCLTGLILRESEWAS